MSFTNVRVKMIFILYTITVLLGNADVKDELNPSEIVILLNKNIAKIEHYKEKSIRKGFHLAIHLNCKLRKHAFTAKIMCFIKCTKNDSKLATLVE